MNRTFTLAAGWLWCSSELFLGWVGVSLLTIFYTVIGPFACLYVGARLGTWIGLNDLGIHAATLAGLWFFSTVRLQLYYHVARRRRWLTEHLRFFRAERERCERGY